MKSAASAELESLRVKTENVVRLPLGLLGFESVKEYVLLADPEEAPFLWLQVLENPNLAFVVVAPTAVCDLYEPEVSDEDAAFLNLQGPVDALVFNIVTLRDGGAGTVNLKGPIILNRRTLVGKQIVPLNAAQYSLRHPLPAELKNQ